MYVFFNCFLNRILRNYNVRVKKGMLHHHIIKNDYSKLCV